MIYNQHKLLYWWGKQPDEVEEELNELSKDGWEVICPVGSIYILLYRQMDDSEE